MVLVIWLNENVQVNLIYLIFKLVHFLVDTSEVKRIMIIVFSWRGETSPDAWSKLKLQFLLKVTLYDLNVCHYLSVCSINWNLLGCNIS